MTKIQVPEGMLVEVARKLTESEELTSIYSVCNAFAQVLAEHPIVPTDEWVQDQIKTAHPALLPATLHCRIICEWQRRMFLAEPEIPEEVKDLLSPTCQNLWEPSKKEYDAAVLEAFRRGRSKG